MKQFETTRNNLLLYQKLQSLAMKNFNNIPLYTRNPSNSPNRTLNSFSLKNQIRGIAQENLYMYKRLMERQSTYDANKWIKDYKQNQKYKNNVCKFPSINFYQKYKRKKKSLSNNKYSHNTVVNDILKNGNNIFPKIVNTIDVYSHKKFKKRKKGKKKFEDFDYKDVVKLQIHKKRHQTNFNSTTTLQKSDDKEISEIEKLPKDKREEEKISKTNHEEDGKIIEDNKENSKEENKKENENKKNNNDKKKIDKNNENSEEGNNSNEESSSSNGKNNDENNENKNDNESENDESNNENEDDNENNNKNESKNDNESDNNNESENDNENESNNDNESQN